MGSSIATSNWRIQRSSSFFRSLGPLAVCLLLIPLLGARSYAAEQLFSKSNRFRIPFQFDANELRRLQAVEIQLYTSSDGGESWHRVDSVVPSAGKFNFVAPSDGSYWFSVKTVSVNGQLHPGGRHIPGLNVVVDSVSPEIRLQLVETEAGRLLLDWSVSDDHLDISTLVLETRESSSSDWRQLEIRPVSTGQTSWNVTSSGIIEARATVSDKAGNKATVQTNVVATEPVKNPDKPDFSRPVATNDRPRSYVTANSPLTTDEVAPGNLVTALPESTEHRLQTSNPPAGTAKMSRTSSPGYRTPQKEKTAQIPTHTVNSTTFRVGYELENVGPSGVGNVELYITENHGEEWFHYGTDPDKTSPFVVTVPAEGQYGFAFRISNGAGYVADPPQPAELPEVVVIVDQTPPVGDIKPLQQGAGPERNQLMIVWTAQDRELASRPVTLFFSADANGPWEQMAANQEASGRFLWTIPRNVARQVFVRMEVRDAAGNVARINCSEPFALDRSMPKARVIGIESVQSAAPPRY